MTPIVSAKYGERICLFKVNLQKLADHIQNVSGAPATAVFQDPELPKAMEVLWKRYDKVGKEKACLTILREYGPRGTVARGIVSK